MVPTNLFLPAYHIRSVIDGHVSFNNETVFKMEWVIDDQDTNEIASVRCIDLIKKMTNIVERER